MKVFWRFFKYLKPYVKPLAAANFFMLLFVIFSLASIGLVMPFIDLLFNQSTSQLGTEVSFSIFNLKEWLSYKLSEFVQSYSKLELVIYLCVLIVVVFLFKNLFSSLQTWFMSFVEQGIIRRYPPSALYSLPQAVTELFHRRKKRNSNIEDN